ncbi:hypothetical protein D5018_16340 [Parashewanella curva]|uniref:Opioid growth factor receptor (OGFr) conserved domain-containing protein n=1 Tax=Parashewanella curva TaxID=2338552 RepID=A0A3L8PTA5_9GAMM|nr:opioid growth factor receptor-related protein [Parashewanella curva]RLV58635.1 hypothetical protein D5018_16340 [Parashewanella curva]
MASAIPTRSPSIQLKTSYTNEYLTGSEVEAIKVAASIEELSGYTSVFSRVYNFSQGSNKANAVVALFHLTHAGSGREMAPHFATLQDLLASENELVFAPSLENGHIKTGIKLIVKHSGTCTRRAEEDVLVLPKEWVVTQSLNLSGLGNDGKNDHIQQESSAKTRTPDISWPWLADDYERSHSQKQMMSVRWRKWMLYDVPLPKSNWTLPQINAFTERERENQHNFIQLVFPSTECSRYNPKAPLLTQEMVLDIQHDKRLQREIFKQFNAMLNHWGIKLTDERFEEDLTDAFHVSKFGKRVNNQENYDHNFQRITRVIIFLKQSGFETLATDFNRFLQDNTKPQSEGSDLAKAKRFWDQAAQKQNLGPKKLEVAEFLSK